MGTARVSAATGLAALLLQACTVGPDYRPPHEPVPQQYSGAAAAPPRADTPRLSGQDEPGSFWWHEFHDGELDKLIEQATAGNLNLQAAYLRIAEARIRVLSASAQGLPSLNASA